MDYRGQQIFIIHPEEELRDSLVRSLRRSEFETFGLATPAMGSITNRRESIFFLDTEDREDWNWREFAVGIRNADHANALVSMSTAGVPKGFDAAITGNREDLLEKITEYLKDVGARGHRHYVRFGNQNASIATFEFHRSGRRYAGIIHDISVVGMSCTFKPEPDNIGHMVVKDIQVNLPGYKVVLPGRFTTRRIVAGQPIHVFLLDRNVGDDIKDRIYDFIYTSLEMKLSIR